MKRNILIILALLCLIPVLSAQDREVSGFGLDPSDQAAIKSINVRMDSIRRHRPTVGLVLAGGGAKGAAHVGAIRYIESLGIPVDLVVGTSMGGLVGGMYALGFPPEHMDSLLRNIDWDLALSDKVDRAFIPKDRNRYKETYAVSIPFLYSNADFMNLNHVSDGSGLRLSADADATSLVRQNLVGSLPSGIVQGLNVGSLIASFTAGYSDTTDFFKLPIPFACVATDLVSGKAKVWHYGSLNTALRSTMSIPGLFTPVRTDGMVLVDGGMRNNFPSDLARRMGADIIIGIELSDSEKGYDQIHNLLDIIMQSVDMMSNDSFRRNLRITDLKIKPDLKGYDMLSFNDEAIDTILRRGYQAAEKERDQLLKVRSKTGTVEHRSGIRPAVDVGCTPVRVGDVEFEGVSEQEAEYLVRSVHLPEDRIVDRTLLETLTSKLYGTGSFDYVGYELRGTGEPYTLCIICRKGRLNQLGIGVRFDTEEIVAALLNLGLNVHSLSGHSFEFTGKVGTNPYADLHYRLKPASGPAFNSNTKFKYVDRNQFRFEDSRVKVNYSNFRQEFSISNIGWDKFDMQTGIRYDYYKIGDVFSDRSMAGYSLDELSNSYFSGFFRAGYDTYDIGYFPRSGHFFDFGYSLVMGSLFQGRSMIHIFDGYYSSAFSEGRFTVQPSVDFRFLLHQEDIPVPFMNMIGGRMRGRYLDQQIPFIGVTNAAVMPPVLAIAALNLRWEFLKNHYLSGIVNVGNAGENFSGFVDPARCTPLIGVGAEYAYNSIVGPIRADLHWSNISHSFGFYLSLGYDF